MPLSMTPGSSIIVMVQFSDADMAFAEIRAARHSQNSRNPLHAGLVFRGFPIHLRYSLPGCSPPFDGSDQVSPAPEGFYFQAFGSLVTLTAAGYNYNMDWTPCVGGTCTRLSGALVSSGNFQHRGLHFCGSCDGVAMINGSFVIAANSGKCAGRPRFCHCGKDRINLSPVRSFGTVTIIPHSAGRETGRWDQSGKSGNEPSGCTVTHRPGRRRSEAPAFWAIPYDAAFITAT